MRLVNCMLPPCPAIENAKEKVLPIVSGGGTKLPYEIMSDYRSEMLRGCAQNGPDWKPVCSDPAKCKDDPNSIYLGQKGNIAEKDTWLDTCHMGWSETCKSGMPYGLVQHVDDFRQKQMCFYIGESNADGMCVLQRMTTPTHDWRGVYHPDGYNPDYTKADTKPVTNSRYYMCAMKTGEWDVEGSTHRKSWNDVKLAATYFSGNKAYIYDFKSRHYDGETGENYARAMLKGCAKYGDGWKPVCDDPDCQQDDKSIKVGLYFGACQPGHLGCDRLTNAYSWEQMNDNDISNTGWPDGLKKYINEFTDDNMCYYTGKNKAVCGQSGTRATPIEHDGQYRNFMCAKIKSEWNDNISKEFKVWSGVELGKAAGVKGEGSVFSFKAMRYYGADAYCHCGDDATVTVRCSTHHDTGYECPGGQQRHHVSIDYRTTMQRGCAQNGAGWKPVCSDPEKCKDDPKAVYIGQKGNIADKTTWTDSNLPGGLLQHVDDFRQKQMCFYIGESNADGMCVLRRMTTPTHGTKDGKPVQYPDGFNPDYTKADTKPVTGSRYYMCAVKTGEW